MSSKSIDIVGSIRIKPEDVNKDILIINSLKHFKEAYSLDDEPVEEEDEIEKNVEIEIGQGNNFKKIPFSYYHKFTEEGVYAIHYSFKKKLTKTNYMFYDCKSITMLKFNTFDSKEVTDMSSMFEFCESLTHLNLSSCNTEKVTKMSSLFRLCESLKTLKLSDKFDTKNVTDMRYMFSGCKSLGKLDLSSFNTENVTDMSEMFEG